MSRMKLRPTPIATPGRMSMRMTPSRAPSDAQNSSDCACQYCVTRPGLIIPETAQMTIAPRTGCGRSANKPARKRIVSSAISALTRKAAGDLAPLRSAAPDAERPRRRDREGGGCLGPAAPGRPRRREPAGDGVALEGPGAEVGGAVAEHLAVRVDRVVVLRGVALGDRQCLRESDDDDREGAGEHLHEVVR